MMLKTQLEWTGGFPLSFQGQVLEWAYPDPTAANGFRRGTLSAHELSRARRAADELVRDFPRALPKLVGPVSAWRSKLRLLMDLVQATIHDKARLPSNLFERGLYAPALVQRAQQLCSAFGETRALVGSISWSHALGPPPEPQLLWLETHAEKVAEAVGRMGFEKATQQLMGLLRLGASVGFSSMEAPLAWLASESVHSTPLVDPRAASDYLDALVLALAWENHFLDDEKRAPLPERPSEPPAVRSFEKWLGHLHQQDARTAHRALCLFELTQPSELIEQEFCWWKEVEKLEHSVRELLGTSAQFHRLSAEAPQDGSRGRRSARDEVIAHSLTLHAQQEQITSRLEELRAQSPGRFGLESYFSTLATLSESRRGKDYLAVMATLEALPADTEGPTRTRALVYLQQLFHNVDEPSRTRAFLLQMRSYLNDADGPTALTLSPWCSHTTYAFNIHAAYFDGQFVEQATNTSLYSTYFAELSGLLRQRGKGLSEDELELLRRLVQHRPEHVPQLFAQMSPRARLCSEYHLDWATASLLTDNTPSLFLEVAEALRKGGLHWNLYGSDFRRFVQYLRANGALPLLRRVLLLGEFQRIALAQSRWSLVASVRAASALPILPLPSKPSWIDEYPSALGAALLELARYHPDPLQAARSILGKDLPRKVDLQSELEVLRERGRKSQSDRIQKRLLNLQERLEQPHKLTAQKQKKLLQRVEEAGARAAFGAWEASIDEAASEALCSLLGTSAPPPWANDTRLYPVFSAVNELKDSSRALGLQILRTRAGEAPWDLRDLPANAEFITRMQRRGLDMDPWLEGTLIQEHTYGVGSITLALEADPLEGFLMGSHFGTCLSPGAFNFFSVISNLADVNKRILYGRNKRGTVQARCLLALTDGGGLLTFHAYSHAGGEQFAAAVREFTAALSREMGAPVVPFGAVSTLVSNAWYDDGAIDLTGRFTFLEDEAFLTKLPGWGPDELIAALRAGFAPLPLNELTLPLALAVPTLHSHPIHLIALAELARQQQALPDTVLADLARRLTVLGELDAAARIFGDRVETHLLSRIRDEDPWAHRELFQLLLHVSPSKLLRTLRRTRCRGDRSWVESSSAERLFLAAEAHRALHQRKKAIAMYQLAAAEAPVDSETRSVAQRRIDKWSINP